jgi:hypothetical protein
LEVSVDADRELNVLADHGEVFGRGLIRPALDDEHTLLGEDRQADQLDHGRSRCRITPRCSSMEGSNRFWTDSTMRLISLMNRIPPVRIARKNKASFRAKLPDGVFTADADWRIPSFNCAAEQITGVRWQDAIGRLCCEVFRASICESACALKQTLATRRPVADKVVSIVCGDSPQPARPGLAFCHTLRRFS